MNGPLIVIVSYRMHVLLPGLPSRYLLSGMRPPAAPLDATQSHIRSIRRHTQPIIRLSEVPRSCVSSLSYFPSNPRLEGTAYQLLHR